MGKPVSGSKPKRGSAKIGNSNLGTYVTLAIVVGAVAWMSLRQEVKTGKKKKTKAELSPQNKLEDDRLQAVKDAFFEKDGVPLFDSSRGGVGAAKGGGSKFSTKEFWEDRYKKGGDYDWYGTWNGQSNVKVKPHVEDHMPPSKVNPVLIIGCGNSRLAGELIEDGYTNIKNVDISTVVIEQMAKRFEGQKEVDFQVMDITNLTFPESYFDVVFDKGTLDALYTGAAERVKVAVPEIYKVLRPGGILISMTFGAPKARKELNVTSHEGDRARSFWKTFTTIPVPKYDNPAYPDSAASYFYIYVAKK